MSKEQPITSETHPIVTRLIDIATDGEIDEAVDAVMELVELGIKPEDIFKYEIEDERKP